MKIQLYVTPGHSGAQSIIRKKDGVYTLLTPVGICDDPFKNGGNYYIDAKGFPCDQKTVDAMVKHPIINSRAIGKLFYHIPDDIELYDINESDGQG